MKSKPSGATIPYHLRPHKAIERNLFLKVVKLLDRVPLIDIKDYRYVGFGAAFLEDFKMLHTEFGIHHMDSIEKDSCAFSRQEFNNPYSFVKLYPVSSTEYITGSSFKYDKKQIIWLDYSNRDYPQQLQDLEYLAEKLEEFDILKVTFNCNQDNNHQKTLQKLTTDETLKFYAPTWLKLSDIANDFSLVIRAMALKALQRGFSKAKKNLEYCNLSAFTYADGQRMTTMVGIVTHKKTQNELLKVSGLKKWNFLNLGDQSSLVIESHDIVVPVMTVSERIVVDKKLKKVGCKKLAAILKFKYGSDNDDPGYHEKLIKGYFEYYTYLPYYSRVTY